MFTITAEGLAKRFDSRWAFQDISCLAQTGKILLLTGPNGAGKSTLLQILLGLLRPSAGEVRCEMDFSPKWLDISTRLGHSAVVTPYYDLYDALTARETMRLFAELRGRDLAKEMALGWLARFGLAGRADDRVGAYSSGMRQRLKLALAFASEPDMLFLDEPASNLDAQGRAAFTDAVEQIRAHCLIVWATNESDERRFADDEVALVS